MHPSCRRRRSFLNVLSNHASIPLAPPILPSYPEPSRWRRRLASCPATTVRLILPLRQMAFSTAFGLRAHSSPPLQPSGFIPLLLLLVHNLTIDLYSSSPFPLPCI